MEVLEKVNNSTVLIDNIIESAENIQSKCSDYLVEDIANNVSMTNAGDLWFESLFPKEMPLNRWALGQLGIKMEIPGSYLDRCISKGFSGLAADNVNTWLKTKEKANMFIRTYNGRVRGILSDRYTVCDAPDILDVLSSNIPDNNWDIKGSYLNEERMHLRFVQRERMNIDGDNIFPAIFVDSSDVGRCALKVQFGFYRFACTNGLIIPSVKMMFHQKHIGIDKFEFLQELRASMTYLPDMIENAESMIKYAHQNKINLLDSSDIESITHEIRAKAKLSEADANKVLDIAKEKYFDSRWGIVNAMTEFAQTKTLEQRIELEKAAGYILAAA